MERSHVCATADIETTIASGGRPSPLEAQTRRTESVAPAIESSDLTEVPFGETVERSPEIWAVRDDEQRLTHGRFVTDEEVAVGLPDVDYSASSMSLASDGSTE